MASFNFIIGVDLRIYIKRNVNYLSRLIYCKPKMFTFSFFKFASNGNNQEGLCAVNIVLVNCPCLNKI